MKHVIYLLGLISLSCLSCKEQRYPGPLSPEKTLETFQLRDGFRIEIFASEPHTQDPVEMVFDENGNAFVAEMPDYPFMPEERGAGRIRVLQDTDGDGVVDNSVIFADSILEVTSMLPWKGGLIVTAAPHILYLKDSDGDLKVDEQEILFTGFFENNSEAQITSLRFGIDNWIYAANNGQAGTVTYTRKPDAPPVSMAGADFRFRLDQDRFELESGAAQFGQTIDDWGNRFITQNTLHIRQVVIPRRYLTRNGQTPRGNVLTNISDHELEMFQVTPAPYWRAERTARRQKQYEEQNLDRVEYAEDHFTGASGGTIYDGDAFPETYYGNVFTGDVAGNLVHRDVLFPSDESPVFIAKRDEGEKSAEFLASSDTWFRPSGFTVGPDGSLFVVDMYRQHIETPLSIPEDLKEDMDFLAGSDRGRIYRIVPDDFATGKKELPNLMDKTPEEYVDLLTHPNRWWRLQAQRLLLERQDASVVEPVKELFSSHKDPRTRLHALYVLEGLDALSAALVRKAVDDEHPGVRKHGLILAERYPELQPQVLERTGDPSLQVVLQAVLSAGEFKGTKVTNALAGVVNKYFGDPWVRMAVLSSEAGTSPVLLSELKRLGFFSDPEKERIAFLEEFSYMVGTRNSPSEVNRHLNLLDRSELDKDEKWQIAGVKGLIKGLERSSELSPEMKEKLKQLQVTTRDDAKTAITDLSKIYAKS